VLVPAGEARAAAPVREVAGAEPVEVAQG